MIPDGKTANRAFKEEPLVYHTEWSGSSLVLYLCPPDPSPNPYFSYQDDVTVLQGDKTPWPGETMEIEGNDGLLPGFRIFLHDYDIRKNPKVYVRYTPSDGYWSEGKVWDPAIGPDSSTPPDLRFSLEGNDLVLNWTAEKDRSYIILNQYEEFSYTKYQFVKDSDKTDGECRETLQSEGEALSYVVAVIPAEGVGRIYHQPFPFTRLSPREFRAVPLGDSVFLRWTPPNIDTLKRTTITQLSGSDPVRTWEFDSKANLLELTDLTPEASYRFSIQTEDTAGQRSDVQYLDYDEKGPVLTGLTRDKAVINTMNQNEWVTYNVSMKPLKNSNAATAKIILIREADSKEVSRSLELESDDWTDSTAFCFPQYGKRSRWFVKELQLVSSEGSRTYTKNDLSALDLTPGFVDESGEDDRVPPMLLSLSPLPAVNTETEDDIINLDVKMADNFMLHSLKWKIIFDEETIQEETVYAPAEADYTYRIPLRLLRYSQPGLYEIELEANDRQGNKIVWSSNCLKEKGFPSSFQNEATTWDQEAPTIWDPVFEETWLGPEDFLRGSVQVQDDKEIASITLHYEHAIVSGPWPETFRIESLSESSGKCKYIGTLNRGEFVFDIPMRDKLRDFSLRLRRLTVTDVTGKTKTLWMPRS